MTTLAELLSPETVQALESVTAEPVLEVAHLPQVDLPPTTTINGVEVDLRSESLFDTECADCGTPRSVVVAPEGVDLDMLVSHPRIVVCPPCGVKRVQGKQGTLVHEVKHGLNLTDFTKAELAALANQARERMVAEAEAALPAKREAALVERAEVEAVDEERKVADRAERSGVVLPEFTLHTITVPALDLSDLSNDKEVVSATTRSPYNKALNRNKEPILDKETATYEVVAEVHRRLMALAGGAPIAEAAPEPKKGKGEKRLVADLDGEAKAKVEAFALVTNRTFDEARKHLEALSII